MSRTVECYEMVRRLVPVVDNLPDGEYFFLMEVSSYEEEGRDFSPEQMDRIERIYECWGR